MSPLDRGLFGQNSNALAPKVAPALPGSGSPSTAPNVAVAKLEFELWPQTRPIATGFGVQAAGAVMTHKRLVEGLLALRSRLAYRPERHYMRGPGPKTLSKLGEMYRSGAECELQERVPDRWLAIMQAIDEKERKG